MKRLDNRTEEDITDVLKWACKDSFWQTNILSTKKLREKFDALVIKKNKGPLKTFKTDKVEEIIETGNKWLGRRNEQ